MPKMILTEQFVELADIVLKQIMMGKLTREEVDTIIHLLHDLGDKDKRADVLSAYKRACITMPPPPPLKINLTQRPRREDDETSAIDVPTNSAHGQFDGRSYRYVRDEPSLPGKKK